MLRGRAPGPLHPATPSDPPYRYNIIYPHGWRGPFFDPRPSFNGRELRKAPSVVLFRYFVFFRICVLSQGFVGKLTTEGPSVAYGRPSVGVCFATSRGRQCDFDHARNNLHRFKEGSNVKQYSPQKARKIVPLLAS